MGALRSFMRVLAAAAPLVSGVSAAQPLTNDLEPKAPPTAAPADPMGEALANGFIPYQPAEDKVRLVQEGFMLAEEDQSPTGDQVFMLIRAQNGIPYVLKYSFCEARGCIFLEAIAPVPAPLLRQGLSAADMNDFNRLNPAVIVTSEQDGTTAIRAKLPARKACPAACQRSGLQTFFNGVNITYEAFYNMSRLVDAGRDRVLAKAPLTRHETVPAGFVKAAFGSDNPMMMAKAYFTKESGGGSRVTPALPTVRPARGNDAFPALLSPAE